MINGRSLGQTTVLLFTCFNVKIYFELLTFAFIGRFEVSLNNINNEVKNV